MPDITQGYRTGLGHRTPRREGTGSTLDKTRFVTAVIVSLYEGSSIITVTSYARSLNIHGCIVVDYCKVHSSEFLMGLGIIRGTISKLCIGSECLLAWCWQCFLLHYSNMQHDARQRVLQSLSNKKD